MKMKHWIPKRIIELRRLNKLRDTYLAQFEREIINGKLHPDFTLHVARSLRSSSRNPNFQNLPKRNEEAKKLVRTGLIPSKGNKLVEVDFSGIEVSTSVLYHKDPTFLNYLVDDNADMHRDNAADIWITDPDDVSKKVRFYAKNCWTFPQFYGDWYGSCAKALWENRFEKLKSGLTCVEHLKRKGVKTYKQFVKHLKKCEDILWNKRFPVYTAWKNKINKQYQKDGYIETYFGFRYTGYLDKKQATNYPIQGTAFHILLWCLIRILSIAKKEQWETKIIGQIHDSMILDLVPEEQDHVLKTIKHVCEREVVDRFDWITTQFRVDVEMSEIDGNFAELEEYDMAA
jgi:DNA polymerase-1